MARGRVIDSETDAPESSQPTDSSDSEVDGIVLSAKTSPRRLVKAARSYQGSRNKARATIRELKRQLADVSNKRALSDTDRSDNEEVPRRRRKRKRVRASADSQEEPTVSDIEAVSRAAREFTLLRGLWLVQKDIFGTALDEDFDERTRFDSETNKIQGQVREVRDILPAHVREHMSERWIERVFVNTMNSQRSNTATRLRRRCIDLFEKHDKPHDLPDPATSADMLSSRQRYDKFRRLIGWVQLEDSEGNTSSRYSSMDAPVIHENYAERFEIERAFRNPLLMHIFVALIRGPTSATTMAMTGRPSAPTTDSMEQIHGISHTTPGAIAACAVLARWALSADDQLKAVGIQTGINWSADFQQYLRLLMTGLRKKKSSTLGLFRAWDEAIFPHSDTSLAKGTHPERSSEDDLNRALELLEADNGRSSSEGSGSDDGGG
ncbi:hypothetical protein GLOTRDRAFT_139897 [Gloeophyllum trabeum ATCC 11539]|uniref:Uncharacterized protein n=1 Tax=Gloeophyllum trabeum (strain ATCC 11539 / FP-39264 / Madison 617) TaxID=670483 RepID=S7RHN2_GLOTA|nr:uncharacterized protein GLOTRDRAFT_139897 [Gloeophyllum trabeum ATCC 11539]EPQ53800.1 hypothetical protein GLOTRDRAFT_139897 [Gloeophyllum trabeum ATCC 11539]